MPQKNILKRAQIWNFLLKYNKKIVIFQSTPPELFNKMVRIISFDGINLISNNKAKGYKMRVN